MIQTKQIVTKSTIQVIEKIKKEIYDWNINRKKGKLIFEISFNQGGIAQGIIKTEGKL